jgi:hypothetical protein
MTHIDKEKQKLVARIKRIRGQVDAIERSVNCGERIGGGYLIVVGASDRHRLGKPWHKAAMKVAFLPAKGAAPQHCAGQTSGRSHWGGQPGGIHAIPHIRNHVDPVVVPVPSRGNFASRGAIMARDAGQPTSPTYWFILKAQKTRKSSARPKIFLWKSFE